jgi:hypothetical protein
VFFRDDAPGGGDGGSANPFNDLSAALAATGEGETLFLYAGSGNPIVFSGALPSDIVFQGEGVGLSTTGSLQIPAGAFPRIQGTVSMGTGNTVRGVQFENPSGNALVMGQGGSVTDNRFTNLSGAAIVLDDIVGNSFVIDNDFQDDASTDPQSGVQVTLDHSQVLNLVASGNAFTTPNRVAGFDNGLRVLVSQSSQLNLTVQQNAFDVQGRGLFVQGSGRATLAANITQNTFTGSLLDGVAVVSGLSSTDTIGSNVTASNNNFSQTAGAGVSLQTRGTGSNEWTVNQNTVNAAGNFGLLFVRSDTAFVRTTANGNTISNAGQAGIQYTSGTPSGGFTVPLRGEDRITMDGNQISASGVSGIDLNLVSQTQAALLLNNTTAARIQVVARAGDACFGAGSNNVGGPFTVNVDGGFSLTFDDRVQTTPAVTFTGAGSVTPGPCVP